MNPVTVRNSTQAIVYDGALLPAVDADWFQPESMPPGLAVSRVAAGRGTVHIFDSPAGPAVLRPYRRGGWVAHLSRDRYLFTGYARSRPFREFDLLARLHGAGLPVPVPLAALCERSGSLLCRGALITLQITGARPLSRLPGDASVDWARIGATLRRFHQAGAGHPDLNAGNILLDERGAVWLVDFDRGRFTPGAAVSGTANLARLRRSLVKLWPAGAGSLEDNWQLLLEGYGA